MKLEQNAAGDENWTKHMRRL